MIRLALVGSRRHNNYSIFEKHVKDWIAKNGKPDIIISGGADGLDSLARKFAREENYTFVEYLPDWKRFGKRAGPIRNQLIVDDSTHMIAFPLDGPGTADSINKMDIAKKPKMVVENMPLLLKRKAYRDREIETNTKKCFIASKESDSTIN